MSKALETANEAIFQNQMTTEQAVRYVVKNADVDTQTAKQAVQEVMTGYKRN